jgi:hypothetical protein
VSRVGWSRKGEEISILIEEDGNGVFVGDRKRGEGEWIKS